MFSGILRAIRSLGDRLASPLPEPSAPALPPIRLRRPGVPDPVPPAEREARALSALRGPQGRYGLGAGGRDPAAPGPWGPYVGHKRRRESAAQRRERMSWPRWCDCSGAVSWVLGVPRRIPGYARGWGYVSTDGLLADARDPAVELVEIVPVGGEVRPWECLVVYGSKDLDGDGDRDRIGHVGIVAAVPDGWAYTGPASLADLSVWHCAASASPTGAIRVSDGRAWAREGVVVRVV